MANIPISSIQEILQDTFFVRILLDIKRNVKTKEAKNYLVEFIKDISILMLYEIAMFLENNELLSKDKFFTSEMKNTIRDRRQWLKHSVYGSNSILNKTDEMGINYSLKTYDVNIVEKYGQLLDFNFENFTYRNDLALVDGVLTSIEEIANTILNSLNVDKEELPILYKKCAEALSDVVAKCDRIFSGKRFSYSTYKLFFYSPLLVDDDKNFILERYRLVSSILKIETLFKNKNLELRNGNLTISIKNFFRKYKAIIIDLLGCDLKNPTTEYSKRLKASIDCKIKDKHFYDVNISLRNNCHYSQINGFTESDIKLLDKYQNIYLKTILKSFKENLYINIDDRDIYQTY